MPDISLSFTPKHKTCLETLVVEYGYWDIQCDEYYANCLTALRAYRKRKPLPQDRQNCHRKLLKQGYSHKKIALGRWNCNKILNKKKANKKSSGSASHEQCLRRLFCEYGSINSSAKKSHEACQRSIKVKRGGN
ncbi:MAG: hypothetical protein KAJ48_08730, partial [Elusimicrobiales bacterium]|nr:hypothetical protein [Elusimicrobiales bacterium]